MKNQISKILIAATGLFLTLSAEAKTVEEALTEQFSQAMKPLDPQWSFYHYYNFNPADSRFDSPENRKAQANEHFKVRMNYAWYLNAPSNGSMLAGPGLYAAIDPLISKNYGNTLFEVRAKQPGLNYFPSSASVSLKAEAASLEGESDVKYYLQTHTFSYYFWADLLGKDPTSQKVKGILHNVFRKLNIVAIEYGYNSELSPPLCKQRKTTALVMFGRQPSGPGTDVAMEDFEITVYRPDLTNLSPEEQERYKLIEKRIKLVQWAKTRNLESMKSGANATDEDINDLRRSSIDCQ